MTGFLPLPPSFLHLLTTLLNLQSQPILHDLDHRRPGRLTGVDDPHGCRGGSQRAAGGIHGGFAATGECVSATGECVCAKVIVVKTTTTTTTESTWRGWKTNAGPVSLDGEDGKKYGLVLPGSLFWYGIDGRGSQVGDRQQRMATTTINRE